MTLVGGGLNKFYWNYISEILKNYILSENLIQQSKNRYMDFREVTLKTLENHNLFKLKWSRIIGKGLHSNYFGRKFL